jgi:renal tumor antigen
MKKYKLIKKKGEGTFSEVVQAMNTETDKMYAVKCMKSSYKNVEQVRSSNMVLRDIMSLYMCTYKVMCWSRYLHQ